MTTSFLFRVSVGLEALGQAGEHTVDGKDMVHSVWTMLSLECLGTIYI